MTKIFRHISLLLLLLTSFSLTAETVSQKEAKHIAAQFFNAAYGQVMAQPAYVYNGKRLTTDRLFSPFYVFNHPAGGFVVISAENKAYPILGYSLTETFNPEQIGEVTTELLRLYAKHIENIRYDSRVPEQAIDAWQNIPHYIDSILNAKYSATDPAITREEAMVELAYTAGTDDAEASTSGFYSPDQWTEMINLELDDKQYLPLGIVADKGIYPVIVHGRKGDYYRLQLDGVNRQFWRLLPTEVLSPGEIAVFGNPPALAEEIFEETPFEFYNSYIALTRAEYEADRASIEDALIVKTPVVQWHGLGHYTVLLPEDVAAMRVYSLDGAQVYAEKYRDTSAAHIDLSQLPSGFYFAVAFGLSGKPYGIKLFR